MRFHLCYALLAVATNSLVNGAEHDPLEVNTHPPPEEKVKLRGRRNVDAVHTRVTRPTTRSDNGLRGEAVILDPLVEPHHSISQHSKAHRIKLRGTSHDGHTREVTVNLEKVEHHVNPKSMLLHNNHKHGHYSHQHAHHERGYEYHGDEQYHYHHHHHHHSATENIASSIHREDNNLHHMNMARSESEEKHLWVQDEVPEHVHHMHVVQSESNEKNLWVQDEEPEQIHHMHMVESKKGEKDMWVEDEESEHAQPENTKSSNKPKRQEPTKKKQESIPLVKLGFNETLYELLHNAPFDIYEKAMGHGLDEDESFPVFTMPTWYNVTGVFSGFSKAATPLIFENAQFLLGWDNMMEASNGASDSLMEIIEESNFHASLIVGKSFGFSGVSSFLGLVMSYYQFGVQKNVLVPFARVEDFFDDVSDYKDPSTKDLEMAALHDMLAQKENNSTNPNPILQLRDERIEEMENLEAIRFQRLFQALIRRSFLFSFGYADCLGHDPYHLRECLDDVYASLIKQETNIRTALDKELATHMARINESFHSHVSEACIMVQGEIGGPGFGAGSCYDLGDLRTFVQSTLY